MPMNDIRNSAMAPRNGVNSWRRRSVSHSPSAISAVTIGTGERKAILGQLNQRRAISGCASGVQMLDWNDITETAPAVVAAVTMPLTYSIATGIGLGFITYALIKLIAGRFADAKPAVLVLALIFAVKFTLG
jgi:hypothetical protein